MTQVDILGSGTGCNIKGATTGRDYNVQLFSKSIKREVTFPDDYILVDVVEVENEVVTSFHTVTRLNEKEFSPEQLKRDYYLILENKPLFSRVHPIDDIKGI